MLISSIMGSLLWEKPNTQQAPFLLRSGQATFINCGIILTRTQQSCGLEQECKKDRCTGRPLLRPHLRKSLKAWGLHAIKHKSRSGASGPLQATLQGIIPPPQNAACLNGRAYKDSRQLVQHPVLRSGHPLQVLLGSASLQEPRKAAVTDAPRTRGRVRQASPFQTLRAPSPETARGPRNAAALERSCGGPARIPRLEQAECGDEPAPPFASSEAGLPWGRGCSVGSRPHQEGRLLPNSGRAGPCRAADAPAANRGASLKAGRRMARDSGRCESRAAYSPWPRSVKKGPLLPQRAGYPG